MRRLSALSVLSVFLVFAGCQASSGGGGGQVKTDLALNINDYAVERVAILDMANTTGDADADEMVDFATRALLSTGKYQFATIDVFKVDAVREGMETEYNRILSRWNNKLEVEPVILSRLLTATGYDAVLGMEVRNWDQIQIEPSQEGTSDTSVGLHMTLFAADGTLLWTASELKTAHSIPYNPEFNRKSTEAGRAITTSTSSVPQPPEIRKLAMEVAAAVAATLPDIPAKTPAS